MLVTCGFLLVIISEDVSHIKLLKVSEAGLCFSLTTFLVLTCNFSRFRRLQLQVRIHFSYGTIH